MILRKRIAKWLSKYIILSKEFDIYFKRQLHQERNPSQESRDAFVKLAEAYHVLSDGIYIFNNSYLMNEAKRKAVYDQFGFEGLKKGVAAHDGSDFHHCPC